MNHSHRHILRGTLFVVLAFTAAGALSASAEVTQDFHKTVPLTPNGTLSLDNINGNVEITGWDRSEVQIDAVKSARDQQRLDEASIEVNGTSDAVHIQTKYPEGRNNNNPASVHYQLHVPMGARVEEIKLVNGSLKIDHVNGDVSASLINGSVHASELAGRSNLSSVNGSVQAAYTSLSHNSGITIKSVNGSIDLMLPSSPNAQVHASTVSGSIKSDFPLTVKGGFVGHSIDGTLGSGGTQIELSNVNGSIRVGPERAGM